MTRGRKPKPRELHVLRGSFRKDRHGDSPTATPSDRNAVKMPRYVKGRAGRIWNARAPGLTSIGVLREHDAEMFAVWCCLAAEFEESPSTMNAARIGQLRGLAASFGMTPSDRARLPADGSTPPDDEFEKFLNQKFFD